MGRSTNECGTIFTVDIENLTMHHAEKCVCNNHCAALQEKSANVKSLSDAKHDKTNSDEVMDSLKCLTLE